MLSSTESVCLSVCVSVTRRYCLEMAEQIELLLHTESPSPIFLHCLRDIVGYLQKYGYLSLELYSKLRI